MNREKVIKGLEYCEEYFNCCDKCPYWDGGTHCTADLAHDALDLLKEQQNQIWEFQDQVEYLTDKLKEHETELCDRCGRRRLKSNRVEGR